MLKFDFWQISKISQKYDILIGQVGKKTIISAVSHFEFNEAAHNHNFQGSINTT